MRFAIEQSEISLNPDGFFFFDKGSSQKKEKATGDSEESRTSYRTDDNQSKFINMEYIL